MNAAQQRKAQRLVHLIAAIAIVADAYGPGGTALHDVVCFLALPVLALTGILVWQAPRIRRLWKRLSERHLAEVAA